MGRYCWSLALLCVFNAQLCAQGDSSTFIQERRSAEAFPIKAGSAREDSSNRNKKENEQLEVQLTSRQKMGKRQEGFGEFAKKKESCPTPNVLLTAQTNAGGLLLPLVMPRPDSRRFPWAEWWGKTILTGLSACPAAIHTSSASHHQHTQLLFPSPPWISAEIFCCLALGLTGIGIEAGIWSRNCWQQLCRMAQSCRTLCI